MSKSKFCFEPKIPKGYLKDAYTHFWIHFFGWWVCV